MDRIDVIPYARQCGMGRWTAQPRSTCVRHQRDIGIETSTREYSIEGRHRLSEACDMIVRTVCTDDRHCGATGHTSKIAQNAYCIHRTFMLP